MIVDKINKYLSSENYKIDSLILEEIKRLSSYNFHRQFMENTKYGFTLRLSSAGSCPRKLSYRFLGYEEKGRKIDARAKFIFFMGDLVEMALLKVAKLSGVKLLATGLNQISTKLKINDIEIEGHPDGLLLDDRKLYLVECKSMSDWGFRDFEKGIIDEGYISQVNMYMESLGVEGCVFVAMNKNNAVLGEKVVNKDPKIVKQTIKNFKDVINSSPEKLPTRRYKPNLKTGKLPWQCAYCDYWAECYPQAEKKVVGKSNQLFIKKEKKVKDEKN